MIEATHLTKRYGDKTVVSDLTFRVRPGLVTGFLGPNGSGKSTTMRMVLGLTQPTSGNAALNGHPYRTLRRPLTHIGALLDAHNTNGSQTARDHLRCLALTNALPPRRVQEVLDLVGLTPVAKKRIKGFSLGMKQRLGIAAALLGNPRALMFDEPVNGLDPEGVVWIRHLMKRLASEGRTVFVSSHLMSEMALTADRLIVISRGKLLADDTVQGFIDKNAHSFARVQTPDPVLFTEMLAREGVSVHPQGEGLFHVYGIAAPQIGDLAARQFVRIHELLQQRATLEEAYSHATGDLVEYTFQNREHLSAQGAAA